MASSHNLIRTGPDQTDLEEIHGHLNRRDGEQISHFVICCCSIDSTALVQFVRTVCLSVRPSGPDRTGFVVCLSVCHVCPSVSQTGPDCFDACIIIADVLDSVVQLFSVQLFLFMGGARLRLRVISGEEFTMAPRGGNWDGDWHWARGEWTQVAQTKADEALAQANATGKHNLLPPP